jgi:hypothetical protein
MRRDCAWLGAFRNAHWIGALPRPAFGCHRVRASGDIRAAGPIAAVVAVPPMFIDKASLVNVGIGAEMFPLMKLYTWLLVLSLVWCAAVIGAFFVRDDRALIGLRGLAEARGASACPKGEADQNRNIVEADPSGSPQQGASPSCRNRPSETDIPR